MDMFQVQYGTNHIPTVTVELTTPDKRKVNGACTGSGSVEALYETLDRLIEEDLKLIDYRISSGGQGKDALAEATVQLLVNNKQMTGRATAQDVIKASRSEEHTSELQSRGHLVCRLLLEKNNNNYIRHT